MDGPLAPHLSREAAGLSRLTLRGGAAPFRLNGYFCNVIFCSQMRWLEQTVTLSSDEGAAAAGARALDQPGAKRMPQAQAPNGSQSFSLCSGTSPLGWDRGPLPGVLTLSSFWGPGQGSPFDRLKVRSQAP